MVRGDYEDMLLRVPTDEMIMKFIMRFADDGTYDELLKAVDAGDVPASFEAAHKLKGLVANLGFASLYDDVYALTNQLRSQDTPADPELLRRVKTGYSDVMHAISLLQEKEG